MVPVGAPDGKAGIGLAILVYRVVPGLNVSAKLPLAALNAHVDHFVRVQIQFLGQGLGVLQGSVAVPVVQEDGVGHTTVGLIPDPAGVAAVEGVLVRYTTAFGDGIVPLNVNALLPHVLQHFPEEGYIRAVNGGLLVDEIAVKSVVLGQLHQLFGVRELTVFILVQPLLGILGRSGDEVLGQGDDAVFVGGVGGSRHGDGDDAILLFGRADGDVLGGPSAGTHHVSILPELKEIVRKLVIGHARIPGGFVDVRRTIVARGDHVQLRIVAQVRIGLGGGEGSVALLQGDTGHQLLRVGVRRRVKVQNVYKAIAMAPGLKAGTGLPHRFLTAGLSGGMDMHRRNQAQAHCHSQKKRQGFFPILFHLHAFSPS